MDMIELNDVSGEFMGMMHLTISINIYSMGWNDEFIGIIMGQHLHSIPKNKG